MEARDRRIVKTRRALAYAMLALLEKQDFSNITVNDLCAEAMVSRSTFYAHFEDKYALLSYCSGEMGRRLFDESQELTLEQVIKAVLERIKDNVRIFKHLVMGSTGTELYQLMLGSFNEAVEKHLEQEGIAFESLPGPLEVVTAFYATGITSAIRLWVSRGMPYSTDEMAKCLSSLLPAAKAGCSPAPFL